MSFQRAPRVLQTPSKRHTQQYIPDSDADSTISSLATPTGATTPRPDVVYAGTDTGLYPAPPYHSTPVNQSAFPVRSATPKGNDVETTTDTVPADSIFVHLKGRSKERARCRAICQRAMRTLGIQEKAYDHGVAVDVLRRIGKVIGDEIEPERKVVEDALTDRRESLVQLRSAEIEVELGMEMIDELLGGELGPHERAELGNAVWRLKADVDDLTRKYEEFDKLFQDKSKELRMMILLHEYITEKYPNPSAGGAVSLDG
ncbi:uncharacterized protein APUU_10250S [Aspergillus puulaauensis]|uniref:Uncharacterized protein n=1 Tax=Aspergillus puulaauensis TaxID=1220207 RepID=A0A7R7X9N8_9EURO|nr:uncharacterized protein APUU_10250S [Aspergillus puulaauensis]BCS17422.1 hypothetical protein APUU_10250S [Aspergillus puulaauensis]